MVITICPACQQEFSVKPYRLQKKQPHPPCCSYKCAQRMLKSLNYRPWDTPARTKKIEQAGHLYTRTSATCDQIAQQLDISRSTLLKWAKQNQWVKFQRIQSVRTQYRRAAVQKLGRKLKPYEQVHHRDGDIHNNMPDNIHVYQDAAAHSRGHASLEACAFSLYKAGAIKFNPETGLYYLIIASAPSSA